MHFNHLSISIRKERKVKPGFTPAEDIGRFRPSRVLRAQAEGAETKRGKASVPGYEPVQVEAAREALATTTISSSSSPSTSAPSISSEGSWRRAAASARVDNKGASNTWRAQKESASSSSSLGAANGSWRKKSEAVPKEETPDDWEDEERKDLPEKASVGIDQNGRADTRDSIASAASKFVDSDENKPLSSDEKDDDAAKRARVLRKTIRTAQALKDRHDQITGELLPEQQVKVDALDDMMRNLCTLGVTNLEKKEAAIQ